MKNFKELDKNSVNQVEKNILNEWKKQDILNKTIENRSNGKNWVFYDGPATANGMPGLHHMVAKFLKDTFCKYQIKLHGQLLKYRLFHHDLDEMHLNTFPLLYLQNISLTTRIYLQSLRKIFWLNLAFTEHF